MLRTFFSCRFRISIVDTSFLLAVSKWNDLFIYCRQFEIRNPSCVEIFFMNQNIRDILLGKNAVPNL